MAYFFFLLDSQIRTAPNATTMVNSPMMLYRTVRYGQQPRQTNTNLLERYYQSLARTNPRFPASQNQTEIGGKNSTAAQHRTYRNPPRDLPPMLGRRETPTHSRAREGRLGFCENALARRIKQKKKRSTQRSEGRLFRNLAGDRHRKKPLDFPLNRPQHHGQPTNKRNGSKVREHCTFSRIPRAADGAD